MINDFIFSLLADNTYCAMKYTGTAEEVTIPSVFLGRPVTILYDSLFAGHKELKKVNIPDTVTDIGGFMFDGCENLTSVDIPSSVVNLWQYAFVRSSLKEVVLPEGIDSIPLFAFKDCKSLEKVVAGSRLKKVSAWAFQGCSALKTFEKPDSAVVDERAFE